MTTSTTSIDIMGLKAAYANLHTDQERDYFMKRYDDVISSFGGITSYDADNSPLHVMRSNPWPSGYDFDVFFFSSRRRHTRLQGDWSSDVCSSDLGAPSCVTQCGEPRDLVGSESQRVFTGQQVLGRVQHQLHHPGPHLPHHGTLHHLRHVAGLLSGERGRGGGAGQHYHERLPGHRARLLRGL